MQLNSHFYAALVSCVAVSQVLHGAPPAGDVREWKDDTGRHTVVATLLRVLDEAVELRKPDGKVVRVPVSRLSASDQAYLQSIEQRGGVGGDAERNQSPFSTYKELARNADSARYATWVIEDFRAFIASPQVSIVEKEAASEHLELWSQRAQQRRVRLGNEWLTPAELSDVYQEESKLIKEAHRLLDVESDDLAISRFEDASRVNRESVRADFYLGLLHALQMKDPSEAVRHFRECVNRLEASPDLLVGSRRANYVASLNNLANAELRMRRVNRALRHWEEAIEISPATPEIVQNLGRFVNVASGDRALKISKRYEREGGDLYATATVANNSAKFDASVGWLYIPYIDSADGTFAISNDDELRLVCFASAVAVAPDYVLAPTYAISDADRFRVKVRDRYVYGKVVAIDNDRNFALLRFEGLNAVPLKINYTRPSKNQDILLAGIPEPGRGSEELRIVRGTVLDSREWSGSKERATWYRHSTRQLGDGQFETLVVSKQTSVDSRDYTLLVHDIVADRGYIGGPLLDKSGSLVGLHLGASAKQGTSERYSLAETGSEIGDFLQESMPGFKPLPGRPEEAMASQDFGLPPEQLSNSVFQLASLKVAPQPKWSHRIAQQHRQEIGEKWTSYDDRLCFTCNGRVWVPCPARNCANGKVPEPKVVTLDRDGKVKVTTHVRVKCNNCGGDGRVECPDCNNGVSR